MDFEAFSLECVDLALELFVVFWFPAARVDFFEDTLLASLLSPFLRFGAACKGVNNTMH